MAVNITKCQYIKKCQNNKIHTLHQILPLPFEEAV
ncbi:hypothetical protein COLO4_07692 [Corchorus olitorius]|uniref:Uncharacterized protein n=1 Tax=Corchorus olitorius TaxID=93759 RepID=A0A1R3KIX1_9ROSI|nr:hypothetical protein COLO4_07692 [Corchorus olitorius]